MIIRPTVCPKCQIKLTNFSMNGYGMDYCEKCNWTPEHTAIEWAECFGIELIDPPSGNMGEIEFLGGLNDGDIKKKESVI